ncbi:MAG: hypothetical protein ACRDHZ_24180 [Ktedonobacteraceae bacterium]
MRFCIESLSANIDLPVLTVFVEIDFEAEIEHMASAVHWIFPAEGLEALRVYEQASHTV